MSSYLSTRPCLSFEQALAPFLVDEGLPFADVLPAAFVEQVVANEGVVVGDTKKSVFTPAVTLWAWLSQVLETDKSCRAAVSRVLAMRVAQGLNPCSQDTAAYCRARPKLRAKALKYLAVQTGNSLDEQGPKDWLWFGRRVTLVDGTTMTMPDTAANQKAYPQPSSQKAGCGFPMIRMVVLMSLATAALLDMALAPYQGKETGETALLRKLLGGLKPGEILLADRYYCTYWLVAMAQAQGVDVVFRMHHMRDYDFRRGQQLGADDHVVTWARPQRPDWMDQATYATMPLTLTVRELRANIARPGCRTDEIVVASTLTDAVSYTKEALIDLYHERWHVEPDILAIKKALGMEHLRCQTPFMIEKEIWIHFLGYNLVRKAGCQAAQLQEVSPRDVSFTATKQTINAARSQLTMASPAERIRQGMLLLYEVGKECVGNRPNRWEPRLVKKRPKAYKHLREPRAQMRARLFPKKTG
jgi:putative transposase